MIKLQVNGKHLDINLPADTPLLWALRDEIGLTVAKFGCGMTLCNANFAAPGKRIRQPSLGDQPEI